MDSLLEIIAERRSQRLCKSMDAYSVKNDIEEIEVSMFFLIVTFFCVVR